MAVQVLVIKEELEPLWVHKLDMQLVDYITNPQGVRDGQLYPQRAVAALAAKWKRGASSQP